MEQELEPVPEYDPQAVRALNWSMAEALKLRHQQRLPRLGSQPLPPMSVTSSAYSEVASSVPDYSITVKVHMFILHITKMTILREFCLRVANIS